MMSNIENEVVYLSYEDAQDLVDRIAARSSEFNHVMSNPEKEAMAQLLSDCGTRVSDIVNVAKLADNYAINAELVYPDDVKNYDKESLNDALFTWVDDGETHYCIQW